MKAGAEIATVRLVLRHWREDDLDAFHALNSDERVMRFFPFRRDRAQAAEMIDRIRQMVNRVGYGWAAVCLGRGGPVIGFAGLSKVGFETAFTPAVEVGWRLLPDHWGKGYATEAAEALLAHGFMELALEEIVAFAVPANTASTAVMQRIGMQPEPEFDFEMPGIGEEHARLRRHAFYRITRDAWNRRRGPNSS